MHVGQHLSRQVGISILQGGGADGGGEGGPEQPRYLYMELGSRSTN